ncbi:MAG: nucleotidyl transferase AbiEii/AbiGii toxin family protein [Actinobacteria bacterium]|nr:nucleotidyl transferase AbiEii/AbiGii toxin family protein [Actinomycetota bacterium]
MNSPIWESLGRLTNDAADLGLRWAVIGGMAVSARAEPRFTRDIDICVLVDADADAEAVIASFFQRGYSLDSLVEHEYLERLATVRLRPPVSEGMLVDVLFASSGLEPEITREADQMQLVPGLTVPVARPAHLVVLKLLARDDSTPPHDRADLASLRPILTQSDKTEVRRLTRIIVERGFHRGRDLPTLAEDYLASPKSGNV